jgi:hypothetical protein
MTGGDALLEPVERLLSRELLNTVALRRQVADALLERAVYPF